MNNKARKQEMIEIFAIVLPVFADFILEDVGISSIKAHDLVADLLLYHPDDALTHIDGLDLASFIETLRRLINAGEKLLMAGNCIATVFPKIMPFWKCNLEQFSPRQWRKRGTLLKPRQISATLQFNLVNSKSKPRNPIQRARAVE